MTSGLKLQSQLLPSKVIIIIIRPPDNVCRKALINAAKLFTGRSSRPSNVYYRFGHSVYLIIPLSILPHPSPNFYRGVKKCEIYPRSSIPFVFEPPSFRNEAMHQHQNVLFWASDDASLSPLNLVQFGLPCLRSIL